MLFPQALESPIYLILPLIPPENIPRINLPLYVIQATIIAVGDDGVTHLLKLGEVVHHSTTEERAAILQCRLINDYPSPFRLDTLHHALDRGLAELSLFDFIVKR